jgi:hypothetical protein
MYPVGIIGGGTLGLAYTNTPKPGYTTADLSASAGQVMPLEKYFAIK